MIRPVRPNRSNRPFQHGFAAVAAIFLIVVLAALGGFLVSISNTQQLTSGQDIVGLRAYWAAKAGIEYGVGTVISTSACPASPALLGIGGYSVCVSCSASAYAEGGSTVTIYRLTSDARSVALASCADLSPATAAVGSLGYTERSVSAALER
jgi:MSHA biogenesis protein MshP